jgi:hypothetical protein
MPTSVPEKLLKLAADIESDGDAPLTRLTVLKKWFERPGRLPAFAEWMGHRVISQKGKASGKAVALFRDAKKLLKEIDKADPVLSLGAREVASQLHQRLRKFQNVYRATRWGQIRSIENWPLLLVDKSLELILNFCPEPSDGYKLAADYCKNYDPSYGEALNGPSTNKIREIVCWMLSVEAREDNQPTQRQ